MVVTGGASHASLNDASLTDPVIAGLRHRVHITENEAMSARVPEDKPARVTVTLTDGRTATHAVDSHRGDFRQPFSQAEIRAKFRDLAGLVLTDTAVAAVEAAVDGLEQMASITELVTLMRG